MSGSVRLYAGRDRAFETYDGFDNRLDDGHADIARLVGADASATMGCGIARYTRVQTVWTLPFDEIIHVLEGRMTVRSEGSAWEVAAGDVLFFPRLCPVEYDVPERVVVFYAKYPV